MDLIRDFKDPGREYSVLAFWFLNGELKKERLAWQIGQMVEKGVYGGFMHPRAYLKTPYLEGRCRGLCGGVQETGICSLALRRVCLAQRHRR